MTPRRKRLSRKKKRKRKEDWIADLTERMELLCSMSEDGLAVLSFELGERPKYAYVPRGSIRIYWTWSNHDGLGTRWIPRTGELRPWDKFSITRIQFLRERKFVPRKPKSPLRLLAECAEEDDDAEQVPSYEGASRDHQRNGQRVSRAV